MLTFQAQVSQNQYLAKGADLVHAVMSVAATRTAATRVDGQKLVEAFLVDCSGSMEGEKIRYAKNAMETAIDLLPQDAQFFIVAGNDQAKLLFPLSPADDANRTAAKLAVRQLSAGGGTAMSTWLDRALQEFRRVPGTIHHALFLTDGRNESEPDTKLSTMVKSCEGQFQCDARGVGTDWKPDQLRLITNPLLGTVDIIAKPDAIPADFRNVIGAVAGKSVGDVFLRLWTPQGAKVEYCKLVYPERVDLTGRAKVDAKNPQTRDYATGAWGEEKRDYHMCIKVTPAQVGQKMLAGRASLIIVEDRKETKVSEAMILAVWTEDDAQSAVINPAVAHYTGQAELADAIQEGLKAREAGDEERATRLLGRAVQIAANTNPETMKLLRKVVQIEDEKTGTVKLLKAVKKEDEFALDTRSIRTARVHKGNQ